MSDTFFQHSFLAHHGILGMKWGVRRYQNKDGSLTSAGRARYLKRWNDLADKAKKTHSSDDWTKFSEYRLSNAKHVLTKKDAEDLIRSLNRYGNDDSQKTFNETIANIIERQTGKKFDMSQPYDERMYNDLSMYAYRIGDDMLGTEATNAIANACYSRFVEKTLPKKTLNKIGGSSYEDVEKFIQTNIGDIYNDNFKDHNLKKAYEEYRKEDANIEKRMHQYTSDTSLSSDERDEALDKCYLEQKTCYEKWRKKASKLYTEAFGLEPTKENILDIDEIISKHIM